MRFKDIVRRITSVSVPPGFGLQWVPPADQRRIAKNLIDTLTNRRVLYVPYKLEHPAACINSAQALRGELSSFIHQAPPQTPVHRIAGGMQRACRHFIAATENLDFASTNQASRIAVQSMFEAALGQFRKRMGKSVMSLASVYQLDVEDELAALIPFTRV